MSASVNSSQPISPNDIIDPISRAVTDIFTDIFTGIFTAVKFLLTLTPQLDTLVLVSLCGQFYLAFTGGRRKNPASSVHPLFIDIAYVWAFWSANYSMVLLHEGSSQGGRTGNLRVFWAPFLILHMGGLSPISAVSLNDNELWLRYAVHLFTLSSTFWRLFLENYVLKNQLWLPTLFVFFAGVIKYVEKIICLFRARLTKFQDSCLPKPDPGENYAKLMQTQASFQLSKSTTTAVVISDQSRTNADRINRLSHAQIVKQAYRFFHDFRGLFVNSLCSYDQRETSRQYFLRRDAKDAFDICAVELNFAYDVFYTKANLIQKTKWPIVNLVTVLLQLASLVLWLRVDKSSLRTSSLYVTHALVYGSVALDLLSLLQFWPSDWRIAMAKEKNIDAISQLPIFMRMDHRWSRIIPQLDLLTCCATNFQLCNWIIPQEKMLSSSVRFSDGLRKFLFEELVTRSRFAEHPKDAKGLCSARGMWILSQLSLRYKDIHLIFAPWVADVDYEESLLLWHIATTLCDTLEDGDTGNTNPFRKLSKVLSDYMLHRLIRHRRYTSPPSAQILGWMIYLDTCAEAKRFFNRVLPPVSLVRFITFFHWVDQGRTWLGFINFNNISERRRRRLRSACEKLIAVNTDVVPPREVKWDESKSVLFDACVLAKKLQRLGMDGQIDKWEIISKVWAEMLFYCAAHSSPRDHLRTLPRGGDLLTLVWLLMVHLGLGNHFCYNKAKYTTDHFHGRQM